MLHSATARNIKFSLFSMIGHNTGLETSSMTLCGHIMIATDIFVCVLIYLGVNSDLQGQKLVKDRPKIANFAPKS